ncbi:ABC transporter substrate-binding protein [Pseudothermotoga sp.]
MKKLLVLTLLVLTLLVAYAKTPKDTLVIAANTGIFITLDPGVCYETFAAAVVTAAYSGLTKLEVINGVITPVPDLAERWEVSQDGTLWTFHLRKGLVFSNGDPLTAEDVVFSLKRVLKIRKSPAWLFEMIGLTAENMEETIVAVDPHTVVLKTEPFAPNIILSIIAPPWGGVVNKKVVLANEVNNDLGQAYLLDKSVNAGAGPYIILEWKRNEIVRLTANTRYWAGPPPIKNIIIRDVPEETTQFLLVQRGDVDVAWNITTEQAAQLRDNPLPNVRLVTTPAQSNEYLGMNTGYGPLGNEKVRLAIKYAIDYDAIINGVMRGFAVLNQNFAPIGYFGYVEMNPFKRDVAKAKQLLAEAGYPDGFEVELMTSTTEVRRNEAVVIQSNLAEIGIKANIVIMPAGEMYAKMRQQGHQLIIGGWGIDYPDIDNLAKAFANYRIKQLAWRCMWYDDYAADLAEKAGMEPDPAKRAALYKELQEYWIMKGPFAMLYQPVSFWAVSNDVLDFEKACQGYSMIFDFTKIRKK